ncbi:MAG TPA: hypothetical protein VK177_12370 [Flavobacteriales bacterium]|nr:hypothetical protein [Flavobacteriales bacterium]
MKKSILLLAFPLALMACGGGSGPEADADKMCKLMKDWKAAKDAGKADEAEKIEEEGEKLEDELEERYKNDEEGKKKVKEKIEACEDELK